MEKLVYLLNSKAPAAARYDEVVEVLLPPLQKAGAQHIHFAVVDEAIAPADDKRMVRPETDFNIYLTFWMPTAIALDGWMAGDAMQALANIVTDIDPQHRRYAVTESTVLDVNQQLEGEPSGIVQLPGWQQVVLLKIPPTLSREQWFETWLYSHADIACEVQSTFGYIHNIVQRCLPGTERTIDAMVSENFPEGAKTDPAVFYDAVGDSALLKRNIQAMIDSCERFIDNSEITVVPMTAYRCA